MADPREEHFVYTPNNEEEAEIAQISQLFETEARVREHRDRMAQQKRSVSLKECVECGEDIPEARRVAVPGVTHCIDCANFHERVK